MIFRMLPNLCAGVLSITLSLYISQSCCAQQAGTDPVKIYLMAGQSNMVGHGNWYIEEDSTTLRDDLTNPANPYPLTTEQVNIYNTPRNDVWVAHPDGDTPTGPLAPGFGGSNHRVGVEMGMGHTLGNALDNQLYFHKSDKGGTTLGGNWRPPSAVASRGGTVGSLYIKAISEFHELLADFDSQYTDYNGAGYEIAGFVWLQGWNEYFNEEYLAEYQLNMVDMVHDVRRDLGIPDLPVIISDCPREVTNPIHEQLAAHKVAAVADLNAEKPGSALYVNSLGIDPVDGQAFYHWNFNAPNYIEMGNRIGSAAQTLMRPTAVNHEGDANVSAAWGQFRDTYNRVVRYEMEEGTGTTVNNSAGGTSDADAVLSSSTAWAGSGLGPDSSDGIDASEGIIRGTHDFGNFNTTYTLGAWVQLDNDLPDEEGRYVVMSTEAKDDTKDTGWNFGVQRKQVGGEWKNCLFFDLRWRDDNYSLNDSTGKADILLEEDHPYFIAFVRNHDLVPEGDPETKNNTMFYLYDPVTETLVSNDGNAGSRQKATTFKNTRVGIGITPGSYFTEDPDTQFLGLIDDAQIWNLSLSEADLMTLVAQGSLWSDAVSPLISDLNNDGKVDDVDLNILLSDFDSGSGGTYGQDDLTTMLQHFGYIEPANDSNTVPEPSSFALLLFASLLFIRRR